MIFELALMFLSRLGFTNLIFKGGRQRQGEGRPTKMSEHPMMYVLNEVMSRVGLILSWAPMIINQGVYNNPAAEPGPEP